MNIFITDDRQYYRRWVNIIPQFFIAGSGQFLSGRKKTGVAWFIAYLMLVTVILVLILHPKTHYSFYSTGILEFLAPLFMLLQVADSCRKPIPRIGFKGWSILIGISLALILIPAFTIRQFFVHPFMIPYRSMQPTLVGITKDANGQQKPGDCIFVNKLIYHFNDPKRGDIAVFNTKGIKGLPQNFYYVKRIVGIPGDTVSINPPYIMVNGQKLIDPPIFTKISESKDGYSGYRLPQQSANYFKTSEESITLGKDEYLVFGDNTNNSLDSRYWGTIKRTSIIGKVFYIYAPTERKGKVE